MLLAIHLLSSNFLDDYGGQIVAGGRVQCSVPDGLLTLNEGLCLDGGWFSDQQLFFAEGIAKFNDIPDYFYIDALDAEPRPVRYFHLTPTDVGVCAASLDAFVAGVWTVTSDWGHSYFPHMTSTGLVTVIRDAFADVPRPDDTNLCISYRENSAETARFFRGRTWQNLDSDDIKTATTFGALCFLRAEAWHYFLPAFLLAVVEAPSSDHSIDTMIHLQLGAKQKDSSRMELLNDAQLSAVEELFRWMNKTSE